MLYRRMKNIARQWKETIAEKFDPGSPTARLLRGGTTQEVTLESRIADQIQEAFARNNSVQVGIEYRQLSPLGKQLEDELNNLTLTPDIDSGIIALGQTLSDIITRASIIRNYLQADLNIIDANMYSLSNMGSYDPRLGDELSSYQDHNYERFSIVRSFYNAYARLRGVFDKERGSAHAAGQSIRNVRNSFAHLKNETEDVFLTIGILVTEANSVRNSFLNYKHRFPVHVDDPLIVFNEIYGSEIGAYKAINALLEAFDNENQKRNETVSKTSRDITQMRDSVYGLNRIN